MLNLNKLRNLPIFVKAMVIRKLMKYLTITVENTDLPLQDEVDEEVLRDCLRLLRRNSNLIISSVANAEATIYFDSKMENATLLRKAARDILTDLREIQLLGFKDVEYLNLLRAEIEELRILFAEWVKTFDPGDYVIDRWGLFNPPGVNYDDVLPEDDIHAKYPSLRDELFFDDIEDELGEFSEDEDGEGQLKGGLDDFELNDDGYEEFEEDFEDDFDDDFEDDFEDEEADDDETDDDLFPF